MLNKRLLHTVPAAVPYIRRNVLFQWLSMLCTVTVYGVLASVAAGLITEQSVTGAGWKLAVAAGALALRFLPWGRR